VESQPERVDIIRETREQNSFERLIGVLPAFLRHRRFVLGFASCVIVRKRPTRKGSSADGVYRSALPGSLAAPGWCDVATHLRQQLATPTDYWKCSHPRGSRRSFRTPDTRSTRGRPLLLILPIRVTATPAIARGIRAFGRAVNSSS